MVGAKKCNFLSHIHIYKAINDNYIFIAYLYLEDVKVDGGKEKDGEIDDL